jgi:anti-sigma-K factor RskA
MKEDDVNRVIYRAFPPRVEALPTEKIWSRIEPEIRPEADRRTRRAAPAWRIATAAVTVAAALALFLVRPHPDITTAREPLDLVLHDFERADDHTRAWLIEHRPRRWRLNEPAVVALDRAIAETRALLEENPGDARLASRVVMYANWRADLLAGLAHENG